MASVDADPPGTPPKQTSMNMALQSVFEPGSISKVVTYSAVLEEGVADPDTVLTVPNELELPTHTFGDAFEHGTERWPVSEVLARSSNIGTIELAQQLGPEQLDSWLRRFGLGQPTGSTSPTRPTGSCGTWTTGRPPRSAPSRSARRTPSARADARRLQRSPTAASMSPSLVEATVDADGERHDVEDPGGAPGGVPERPSR